MHLGARLWTSVSYVLSLITLSPQDDVGGGDQAPLQATVGEWGTAPGLGGAGIVAAPASPVSPVSVAAASVLNDGPRFKPPGGATTGPNADFECYYPTLGSDWYNCSTPLNRTCWLANDKLGLQYNITSNYENPSMNPLDVATPPGIQRYYDLYLEDDWVNADGLNFSDGKIFNGSYPGPWIQACWGDNVAVTVHNRLKHNGTSIHWHGIRQYKTMHMDGVNGITQCPIAPGDSFMYNWTALQYGSSWYHSHFSVQYADGALGPLTLHGPSSSNFDEGVDPLLITDWGHDSAFNSIFNGLEAPSILLNGTGDVTMANNASYPPDSPIPPRYELKVEPPTRQGVKRYLLRLINTSFDSTLIFSIDNHYLQIVGADFVPIHPYWNTSVLIGIGQRYHVIVEAVHPLPTVDDYWISVQRANCFGINKSPPGHSYTALGILRYGDSTENPLTRPWADIDFHCSDETYTSLRPMLPWHVGNASNIGDTIAGEENIVEFKKGETELFPLAKASLGTTDFKPFQIDYSDPMFLHLNYTGDWNPLRVVVKENYGDDDWIYLVLMGDPNPNSGTFGAHPIHLHGHDFAILQQIEGRTFPDGLRLKLDNPPRRDVVLLPNNGYVVIAFKSDNPGAWLMHCHIAFHASFGLAMQIMERQHDAAELWPSFAQSDALNATRETCRKWNRWWGNCENWWPGDGSTCADGSFLSSPDSGI